MFWFLYDANGVIYEAQQVNVTEWTNLNGYAGALGVADTDAIAQDAYANKDKYLVVNKALALQPHFTAVSTVTNGVATITATLNNPPTTPPTSCTFTVAGQTFTENIANGVATLTQQIHPSVANQQINVTVNATGCVSGTINIGGSLSQIGLNVVSTNQSGATVSPPMVIPVGTGSLSYLEAWYALNPVTFESLLADIGTSDNLHSDVLYRKLFAALRVLDNLYNWATTLPTNAYVPTSQDKTDIANVQFTANETSTVNDIVANVLPNVYTTLNNAYPNGGTKQIQYSHYVTDLGQAYKNFENYEADKSTLPGLA